MTAIEEGKRLWEPSAVQRSGARLSHYMGWLKQFTGRTFASYHDLWEWSVTDLDLFWRSIADYFNVIEHSTARAVLATREMPGAQWFPGLTLNYAEHALRRRDDHPALIARDEQGRTQEITYAQLAERVGAFAASLRELGVREGDRVVGVLPNAPEAVIAFLATASLGAVWSSCSPEFGVRSILDRFEQIAPKVLIGVTRYTYGGKVYERGAELAQIAAALPSLAATVVVDVDADVPGALRWSELVERPAPLAFTPVPFAHPLWILYSSGTTGLPKAIVHGHGGILLEHFKALALHCDIHENDRFFWFSTTGWMMWNFVIGGLLLGSTVVLYDGSPGHPDLRVLWRMAEELRVTYFGASAPYLLACRKAGISPAHDFDLGALRSIGSTGAPLPVEGFAWVYEHVKRDVLLGSVSGGTDMCTAFVLSCPLLPVHAGEIQCSGLGHRVEAFGPDGKPIVGEVGELVITEPAPSMPVFFWNDEGGKRLHDSYFAVYPGVWRHGDWIKQTKHGGYVIYGRSDSTLNRGGVRMGTSEFYRVVEALPEVADSVVVDTGVLGREDKLWLFVVLKSGVTLDDALVKRIKAELREKLSPRHVPDEIRAVAEVPRTLNNKKLEVPIKKILTGEPVASAVNPETLMNPRSLEPFAAFVRS